jgi:PST family polysaccharide transporter
LRHPLAINALSLYAVQGLNYLVPLIILPYLLRILGPSQYGSIIFAQSLMGYGVIFTEFGFNFTATREISVCRGDSEAVARIYWTTMAAKAVLLIASLLVTAAIVFLVPEFRKSWQIFAACSLLIVGNLAFPQWYFQGLEKLRDVALLQATAKCVLAGSVLIFVRSPADTLAAALILSAPQLFGALAAVALRRPFWPANRYRPKANEVRGALTGSWHMFASIVSTTLYLHTNTFVLGLLRGDAEVALYSVGTRLMGAVQGAVTPVSQAVFPRASILFAQQRTQAWSLLRRVAWLLLPAIALLSLLVWIYAQPVVQLLGGPQFTGAASVVRIMAPIPVLVTMAMLLSQLAMANIGLTRELFRIYVVVGLLNLLLLPLLVLRYAADGAAMALLLAEAIGPVLMLMVVRRHYREAH